MLVRISKFRHIGKNAYLFTSVRYSTDEAISTTTKNPFLSDYLIKLLGFSRDEANSATAKLNSMKPPKSPDLVIKFFQEIGLERTEIKKLVSITPQLLFSDVNRTLKPKFQCLLESGLSGSDLVNLFRSDARALFRGVDSHFRPSLEYLRKLFSSEECLVKAIKKSPWLLAPNGPKQINPKILLLQRFGFSNPKIEKLLVQKPRVVLQKTGWLEEKLHRVEKDLQISPKSGMFFYGVIALVSVSNSTVKKKMGIFRSSGWCDLDIMTVFRKQPLCLVTSEAKIQRALDFFTGELGYKPEHLVCNPAVLMLSLDKRVIPRNDVLKVLEEKKLNQKVSFLRALRLSERMFRSIFVLPYKEEVPNLYESYMTSVRR
ncbi:PREDICTED: uncharacterized protein LOC109217235 [Nicotiana attenuata]|uniref:Uncharacterized protein n=1 Tax=Nicotiana attenuata TaxID=49451 RepID=A0A1J6KIU7_NICAT|nr:PREDICTED: uncharacterized protein LOC109217235 [Nicotiana attenuata]OIT22715.1 hypothetical protein A4A49_33248 [Nicotiana attenuata]